MRKQSFYLLLFSGSLLVACGEHDTSVSDSTVQEASVMVNLASTGKDELEVFHIGNDIHHKLSGEMDSVSLKLEKEVILDISQGRGHNYVHVKPGEALMVDTLSSGPTIMGVNEGSKENNYLAQFARIAAEQGKQRTLDFAKSEADSFLLQVNQKYEPLTSLVSNIEEDAAVSGGFKASMKYRLIAIKGNDMLVYGPMYNYWHKNYPEIPDSFYDELKTVDYMDPALLTFAEGRRLGSSWHSRDLDSEDFDSEADYMEAQLESAMNSYPGSLLSDYCYMDLTAQEVNFGSGIDGAGEMIESFRSRVKNTYLNNKLNEAVEPWMDLKAGMEAPNFKAVTREGEDVTLSELQGKKVYVDVWATWCGPCIREIPHLKELEAELHEENIEFVSVSIDKEADKEKWMKFVEEKELKGVQLMADGAWKSDVVTEYNIQGIPRFLLIDEEGKILSANAKRPSDPEIKADLMN